MGDEFPHRLLEENLNYLVSEWLSSSPVTPVLVPRARGLPSRSRPCRVAIKAKHEKRTQSAKRTSIFSRILLFYLYVRRSRAPTLFLFPVFLRPGSFTGRDHSFRLKALAINAYLPIFYNPGRTSRTLPFLQNFIATRYLMQMYLSPASVRGGKGFYGVLMMHSTLFLFTSVLYTHT